MNKASNNSSVGIPFFVLMWLKYNVPENRRHTTVFNAVATAFFDTWAAQLTFPRPIFPNVVESIITVSSKLKKYDSIHLHLCTHHLLLLFISPQLQRARLRPFFLSQLPIFFSPIAFHLHHYLLPSMPRLPPPPLPLRSFKVHRLDSTFSIRLPSSTT